MFLDISDIRFHGACSHGQDEFFRIFQKELDETGRVEVTKANLKRVRAIEWIEWLANIASSYQTRKAWNYRAAKRDQIRKILAGDGEDHPSWNYRAAKRDQIRAKYPWENRTDAEFHKINQSFIYQNRRYRTALINIIMTWASRDNPRG